MGAGYLRSGGGFSLLVSDRGPESRGRTVSPTRGHSTVAAQAATRAHDLLQRAHLGANAPSGLAVIELAYGSYPSEFSFSMIFVPSSAIDQATRCSVTQTKVARL